MDKKKGVRYLIISFLLIYVKVKICLLIVGSAIKVKIIPFSIAGLFCYETQ